ncbi:hypothetical protein M0R36_09635 [bacterium]|jgi:hypothetical protein|nr:hypothetical protein [bacterium]
MRYNFFNYYLKYNITENFIKEYEKYYDTNVHSVYIFLDLQNCLKAQFYDDVILNMYQLAKYKEKSMPVVYDVLMFISRTREWFDSKNIKSFFIFYWDEGASLYHRHIDKTYKENRLITKSNLPIVKFESGKSVLKFQKRLLNEIAGNLKNVKTILSKDIDSDFVPYFVLKENPNLLEDKGIMNLLFTTDHDMYQATKLGTNVFQYFKTNKDSIFLSSKMILSALLDKPISDISQNNWFNDIFTLGGCRGDNISSVWKRCGWKTIYDMFLKLKDVGIDFEEHRKKVMCGEQTQIEVKNIKNISVIKKISEFNDIDSGLQTRWKNNIFLMDFEIMYKYFKNDIKNSNINLTWEFKKGIIEKTKDAINFNNKLKYDELLEIMDNYHDNEKLENICTNLCEV